MLFALAIRPILMLFCEIPWLCQYRFFTNINTLICKQICAVPAISGIALKTVRRRIPKETVDGIPNFLSTT